MPTLSEIAGQPGADLPPTQDPAAQPSGSKGKDQVPNYYCLEPGHDPRLLTDNRMFFFDPNDPHCPKCPVCQKEVSAQFVEFNAKGQPQIPRALLSLADRIGERV